MSKVEHKWFVEGYDSVTNEKLGFVFHSKEDAKVCMTNFQRKSYCDISMKCLTVPDEKLHDHVLGLVEDLVSSLLFYDRKEDEDCPRGVIEDAVERKLVTVDEMIERFTKVIKEEL